MSKRHSIFTENFAISFSQPEKLETCRNLNLANFTRPSFLDDLNVTNVTFIR